MSACKPEELQHLFAERANAADLDGLVSLYEEQASFVGPDGVPAIGKHAIRKRLEDLLALAPRITNLDSTLVSAGEIALISNRWRMRFGEDPSGPSFEGGSVKVTRRQPDGSWLYVIDNPSVTGAVQAEGRSVANAGRS